MASGEVFSARLVALLDDILQGKAPSAGRFCGYCYHPLPTGRQALPTGREALAREPDLCPHCAQTGARQGGRSAGDWPAASRIPDAVVQMHRVRRGREALPVRTIAWGGLTLGVIVALLPLIFAGANWWSILSFFGILALFYVVSANLANSLGDALGYRWGQAIVRRRWERFLVGRDGRAEDR